MDKSVNRFLNGQTAHYLPPSETVGALEQASGRPGIKKNSTHSCGNGNRGQRCHMGVIRTIVNPRPSLRSVIAAVQTMSDRPGVKPLGLCRINGQSVNIHDRQTLPGPPPRHAAVLTLDNSQIMASSKKEFGIVRSTYHRHEVSPWNLSFESPFVPSFRLIPAFIEPVMRSLEKRPGLRVKN